MRAPTNKQDQSPRRSFLSLRSFRLERRHAMNDGRHEIDVEDGPDVDQMKDDGHGQEAKAADARHVIDGTL